jgi:hypothetical protein
MMASAHMLNIDTGLFDLKAAHYYHGSKHVLISLNNKQADVRKGANMHANS